MELELSCWIPMIFLEMFGYAIPLEENATTTLHLYVWNLLLKNEFLNNVWKVIFKRSSKLFTWIFVPIGTSTKHTEGNRGFFRSKHRRDCHVDLRRLCSVSQWIDQGIHQCRAKEILVSDHEHAKEWWGLASSLWHGC